MTKWRKFANSLQIRYYLRLSTKEPEFARTGITKILGNASKYPLILDVADDAAFAYPANIRWITSTSSDPTNMSSGYHRTKMCATLVEVMRQTNDPRLGVWAKPVEIPLVLDESRDVWPDDELRDVEFTIHGEKVTRTCRVVGKTQVEEFLANHPGAAMNYNPDYVGMPPNWTSGYLYHYNLNPARHGQGGPNPHCSMLSDIYQLDSHPLLKSRMLSAAEMHFNLAEIALKGWGGDAATGYHNAIMASLQTWDVAGSYDAYIAMPGVAWNGSLEQIITQKWIASWSATCEAWFDWRRTGFPQLTPVAYEAKRAVPPVRFYYVSNEESTNIDKLREALPSFEETTYSMQEPDSGDPIMKRNSAWSKMWLLQGTGKPW